MFYLKKSNMADSVDSELRQFEKLLSESSLEIQAKLLKSNEESFKWEGRALEPVVYETIRNQSIGTVFEGSVELISGQKFPDIVVKQLYGIEIKTTKTNHWRTTGNSIFEGTRVDGVQHIYMLFAKLAQPCEVRFKLYEDCLSDVVVTHSPRYLIDMNLASGETIFDKLNMSYSELRSSPNPIKPIINYYQKFLKPGDNLWWMDADESRATKFILRIWNNISNDERKLLKIQAMVLFPEIFGSKSDKFGKLATWLVMDKSVVCPNVRDIFTSGGKSEVLIGNKSYNYVPRVLVNLAEDIELIIREMAEIPIEDLEKNWAIKTSRKECISDWVSLVVMHSDKVELDKGKSVSSFVWDAINKHYHPTKIEFCIYPDLKV